MGSYLRLIKRSYWHRDPAWLAVDDVPATALKNVGDRHLSVFEVANDETALRVAVALAASKSRSDLIEYVLFDPADIESLDISVKETLGETLDSEINKLHRDLSDITVRKACGLAQVIGIKGIQRTVFQKEVELKISEYCETGIIDRNGLSPKLRARIPFNS